MLSPYFLDAVTEAYLRTLLQTERPDSAGEDGVTPEAYDVAPLSTHLQHAANADAFRFSAAGLHLFAAPLMDGTTSLDRIGYDFALTRNGHGAGFWDSPTEYGSQANADALTRLCDTFPEVNVYMGDDGQLYT
jgi:hypothetical protein